ncbi:hypothetical protein ACFPM3_12660 [Streptomyces coeruleoprunus]|uniref:Uncharacterized protein n=1 Tax=Streptomyces coeruleoprunus TaxID=285563 RepID=A0ABV9XE92_9ACTN
MIAGQLVELPGTIAAIRAALDEDRAKEFDAEILNAPVADLPMALVRWALSTTEADREDAELFERLARGEDVRE